MSESLVPPVLPDNAGPYPWLMGDIKKFHEHFGLTYDGPPRELSPEFEIFREAFIAEEVEEFFEANSRYKRLDACVDLVYVVLGYCYLHGWNFDEAWRRVHAANMTKIRCDDPSKSVRGGLYDVIKPPGWVMPDLRNLV